MKDMKPFIIEIVFGIILIGVSFFVKNDYYSTMVFSMGFGLIAASVAQIIRITYWKIQSDRKHMKQKNKKLISIVWMRENNTCE